MTGLFAEAARRTAGSFAPAACGKSFEYIRKEDAGKPKTKGIHASKIAIQLNGDFCPKKNAERHPFDSIPGFARNRISKTKTTTPQPIINEMKTTHQTLYNCPDSVVQVIRKSEGLNRFPIHSYPCLMFILDPNSASRVRRLPDGKIEFMPNFDELRALIKGIDPEIEAKLPESFRNKPREL